MDELLDLALEDLGAVAEVDVSGGVRFFGFGVVVEGDISETPVDGSDERRGGGIIREVCEASGEGVGVAGGGQGGRSVEDVEIWIWNTGLKYWKALKGGGGEDIDPDDGG